MNYFPLPARCRRSLPIRCYQFLLFYAYRAQHSKIGVFISYFLQGFFYGFRSVFSTNPCRKHTFFCRIIFSCFDCDLIVRHPYSLLSCPPIEVHRRRNTAFITVFVAETDDGTASSLIGAPNTFHARTTHNFIGRCAAERAFLALRFNVFFHFFSSNLLQNSGGSSKGGRSQKLQTYLQHTSFFALLKRRWAHLSHSGAFLLGISDAMSTPVA